MRIGLIGGTGVYRLPDLVTVGREIKTRYGIAHVQVGTGDDDDVVFITRHGVGHSIPPHKVNYRANIAALKKLGVSRAVGINCVGSMTTMIPPGGMVLLDQFIDFSAHREPTFFEGGETGVGHVDMTEPYCPVLREKVWQTAVKKRFELSPAGTYISCNGPRFECRHETAMMARWGAVVIGMTGAAEAVLAREAGLHFAAVAYSINYGPGLIDPVMKLDRADLAVRLPELIRLLLEVLRSPFSPECICEQAVHYIYEPAVNLFK